MLTMEFTAGDVARIRFALSCLWEAASSFHTLLDPPAAMRPWASRVLPALAAAGLAPGGDNLLTGLIPAGPRYMPDFLTPPSRTLTPSLAAELQVLLATDPAVVRAELDLL